MKTLVAISYDDDLNHWTDSTRCKKIFRTLNITVEYEAGSDKHQAYLFTVENLSDSQKTLIQLTSSTNVKFLKFEEPIAQ